LIGAVALCRFREECLTQWVALGVGFWDDLRWWAVHLRERYSISWVVPQPDDAVLLGTDASDWGTGKLAWLDGTREVVQLEFTRVEPIRMADSRADITLCVFPSRSHQVRA
jgi:hypothetical protein